MSVGTQTAGHTPAISTMSVFERYLSVWVLLCIVSGIALGQFAPGVFQAIGRMEVAQVNLPVGLLIWVVGHIAAVWAAKRDPLFVEVGRRHLRIPAHLSV